MVGAHPNLQGSPENIKYIQRSFIYFNMDFVLQI